MKIAICDDEREDLYNLRDFCVRFDASLSVDLFDSGTSLLSSFEKHFYDIIFLDIEMSAPNGLEVGTILAQKRPAPLIFFVTQSLNYAIRGYGIATRYLPKPIDYETFSSVMDLAIEKIRPQKIIINSNGEQYIISVNDLSYIEVIRHQVLYHFNNRNVICTRGTLSGAISSIGSNHFAQSHKSYYVNLDQIDRVSRQNITMTNGELVPIGRTNYEGFHKLFEQFLKRSNLL